MKTTMKRILSLTLCMLILMSVGFVGASAEVNIKYLYEDIFVEYLRLYAEDHDDEGWQWYTYREIYYYYGEEKGGFFTAEEAATPDYVLVEAMVNMGGTTSSFGVFGEYVVKSDMCYAPYNLIYHIYTPEDGKIYTLSEAWDSDIEGLDKVFTEAGIGRLMGDMDWDGKLTIKDATYIQQMLVGSRSNSSDFIGGIPVYPYFSPDATDMYIRISDINRDDSSNIKDATEIQKRVAGITDAPEIPEFTIPEGADFAQDQILVFTYTKEAENYTLEDFPEYEFVSMEKTVFASSEGAMYVLNLKTPGKESVEAAINALLYRTNTDLANVCPNYIMYLD